MCPFSLRERVGCGDMNNMSSRILTFSLEQKERTYIVTVITLMQERLVG